ncbi:hypothetical protein BB558_004800 [Smittium angustum]|uniref:NADPH:adrenodoxin oxidoreductase, mitochondrial n=1 Tax=Smittium angustum TaxID=133377 RepID=A0A2U1J2B7_SMIAN|nr:hypothetical protein BB558_004800 [Smittium angustum]
MWQPASISTTCITLLRSRNFHSSTQTRRLLSNALKKQSFFQKRSKHHVAIVGAGPAGFYTASKLLDKRPDVLIDLFEKLPIPYGLVRFGVAPDHPEVKSCSHKFDQVGMDPRVRYFGNVKVGLQGLPVEKLSEVYDAIVFSYGTSVDKKLGIPGENGFRHSKLGHNLGGIHSGRDFVNFYNGYPFVQDFFDTNFFASGVTNRAAVFGMGNVALDIARIMLLDIETLSKTDITNRAIEVLSNSKINHVDIIGRRGPIQSAFTTKELRELLTLPNVRLKIDSTLFKNTVSTEQSKEAIRKSRPLKRKIELISKYIDEEIPNSPVERLQDSMEFSNSSEGKSWSLRFFESPLEALHPPTLDLITDTFSSTQTIRLGKNSLVYDSDNKASIVSTGHSIDVSYDIAFRSVGYESRPIPGVPFNEKKNIIPNASGRILNPDSDKIIPKLYVSGWLKTGPNGVIANTMQNAFETANAISMDFEKSDLNNLKYVPQKNTIEKVDNTLKLLGAFNNRVDYKSWMKIQEYEDSLGLKVGKPREKITLITEMLKIANS